MGLLHSRIRKLSGTPYDKMPATEWNADHAGNHVYFTMATDFAMTWRKNGFTTLRCAYFLKVIFRNIVKHPAKFWIAIWQWMQKTSYIANLVGGENIIRQVLDAESPLLLEALKIN